MVITTLSTLKVAPRLNPVTVFTIVLLVIFLLQLSSRPSLPNTPSSSSPTTRPPSKFCDLPGPCVLDIGHNNGQDTRAYLSDGHTRVVAVEANPVLINASRHKFATEIADGRLVLVGVGLAGKGAENGSLTFWVNENDKFSSFQESLGCRDGYGGYVAAGNHSYCRKVELDVTTCARLVERFGRADYVKIDIEGMDRACVESLGDVEMGMRPQYVSVENVNEGMVEVLVRLGYGGFKAVNQAALQVGTDEENRGRSGPWGEAAVDEVSGHRWMGAQEFARRLPMRQIMEMDGETMHVWYDLHAKLGKSGTV